MRTPEIDDRRAFRGPDEVVTLETDALDRPYVRVLRITRS